jgi:hypothetical protein
MTSTTQVVGCQYIQLSTKYGIFKIILKNHKVCTCNSKLSTINFDSLIVIIFFSSFNLLCILEKLKKKNSLETQLFRYYHTFSVNYEKHT